MSNQAPPVHDRDERIPPPPRRDERRPPHPRRDERRPPPPRRARLNKRRRNRKQQSWPHVHHQRAAHRPRYNSGRDLRHNVPHSHLNDHSQHQARHHNDRHVQPQIPPPQEQRNDHTSHNNNIFTGQGQLPPNFSNNVPTAHANNPNNNNRWGWNGTSNPHFPSQPGMTYNNGNNSSNAANPMNTGHPPNIAFPFNNMRGCNPNLPSFNSTSNWIPNQCN